MPTVDAFEAAVRRHDERLAALGLTVWVGSEPTFTDRHAQTPEWISQALGGDKEERALAVTAALVRRFPGAVVLRSVGRQYPGEERPRWSLGLYRRRDGQPLW
ncbi:MAG TPA: transglutaminase family protein, partial [Rubrivivax sp.]|nr:transglutaminase family protein [Rubrivivax sp.]